MRAQVWMSLFSVRSSGRPDRPGGVYGAAFVDYEPGSELTYHELLVARLVRAGRSAHVRITDIWVDSAISRDGGRSLWAIPKHLADLPLDRGAVGPVERTSFSGVAGGQHLATARFTTLPGAAMVRMPFATSTSQLRDGGTGEPAGPVDSPGDELVVSPFTGSHRGVPSRASWTFDPDGPLGFLHGRRSLASFRLKDTRLNFG
jgi:acetoacetate decarboxylase